MAFVAFTHTLAAVFTRVTAIGLHPILNVVLGLCMLLGRLEIIALLVVLYPGTWIGDELEYIYVEVGLEDTNVPARTIGRFLADMFEGQNSLETSTMIRGEACEFSFVATEAGEVPIDALDLPKLSRVVCIHCDDRA